MKAHRFGILLTFFNVVLFGAMVARSMPARAQANEPAPAVLRAQLIELVGADGVVRAQLKVEEDGEAVFRMRDRKGEVRVKIGASENGSGMVLLDAATEPGLHVLVKRDGPSLTLNGKDGQKRVITP